jgi:hypothetical protein
MQKVTIYFINREDNERLLAIFVPFVIDGAKCCPSVGQVVAER